MSNSMQMEFEPLVDSQEAAKLLGIHPKTLQGMARRGDVPAIRIGKFWRFRVSELDTWIASVVNSDHDCTCRESHEEDI